MFIGRTAVEDNIAFIFKEIVITIEVLNSFLGSGALSGSMLDLKRLKVFCVTS